MQYTRRYRRERKWQLWKRANRFWSNEHGKLFEPLGQCILTRDKQRQRHQAYLGRLTVAERDVSIWLRVSQDYDRCESIHGLWHYRETDYTIPWESIPDATFWWKCFPVEAWPNQTGKGKMIYTGNVFIPYFSGPATYEAFAHSTLPPLA
jgi:hypothetical protein